MARKKPPLTVRQHPGADYMKLVTLEISLRRGFNHKWTRESSDLRKNALHPVSRGRAWILTPLERNE